MRKKYSADKSSFGYGMGFPLMLVFYVVMALLTFSMISLMTVKHSYQNEISSVEGYKEYNQACNKAEEWIDVLRQEDSTALGQTYKQEFDIDKTKKLVVAVKFWDNSVNVTDWRVVVTKNSKEQTVRGL
ncbi:MAG: hypothetical protein K5851_06015 [Lachnospiraceae bacterium]|nr:hypothetical protein [Lachnospiraceae bacterium]